MVTKIRKTAKRKYVNWAVRDRLKADWATKLGAAHKAKMKLELYDKTHVDRDMERIGTRGHSASR